MSYSDICLLQSEMCFGWASNASNGRKRTNRTQINHFVLLHFVVMHTNLLTKQPRILRLLIILTLISETSLISLTSWIPKIFDKHIQRCCRDMHENTKWNTLISGFACSCWTLGSYELQFFWFFRTKLTIYSDERFSFNWKEKVLLLSKLCHA